MKILIKIDDSRAICIPAELAGPAATIVAQGVVMERSWNKGNTWTKADGNAIIEFIADESLEPITAREQKLIDEAAAKNTQWYTEYTAHNENKKRVTALEAELATIRSLTTCKVAETEPAPDAPISEAEENE